MPTDLEILSQKHVDEMNRTIYFPITVLEMKFLAECTYVRSANAKIEEIIKREPCKTGCSE
jgi:hypothetical protein